MSWLVYRITHSAFVLGLVAFSSQIFSFILSPFIGVLVDRYSRCRILIITQILSMLQAFILFFLVTKGLLATWHIISLSMFLGIINSLDVPARQAFVVDMVEKKQDLGNAIALNSFMFNVARLAGPSVAGIVIAVAGESICFLANGLSYIAVIIALFFMKIKPQNKPTLKQHMLKDLKQGFTYSFGFAPIKNILFLTGITSLMGMSYAVLMPVFAVHIFGGGPQDFGFLMGAVGVGALFGTIYLACHLNAISLARKITVASAVFGISLVIFSFSHNIWFSVLVLAVIGFSMLVQLASSNTVLQTIIEDNMRGRVMGLYTMAFMGLTPFGSLLAGSLANKIGAPNTLAIGGACCIFGSFLFAAKESLLQQTVEQTIAK
jgi:MFS family permease